MERIDERQDFPTRIHSLPSCSIYSDPCIFFLLLLLIFCEDFIKYRFLSALHLQGIISTVFLAPVNAS
jgi:hypothetical protein